MNRFLRTVFFALAALCLVAAGLAFALPASTWGDLGVPEPSFGQSLAPLGAALVAALVAVMLKNIRSVEYHGVQHYGRAAAPRIAKPSARPGIARKVKRNVRETAAARVRAARR